MNDVELAVRRALEEDIGTGDVTSAACIPADREAAGVFLARQDLVLAGTEVLPLIYNDLKLRKRDGETAIDGEVVAQVRGKARDLLAFERTTLNFLQRMSGIATLARAFVQEVAGTKCKVLDTRKTTPGLRMLEKHAAAAGGVTNHRIGLFDAILIKNNHIAAAGGVKQALANARAASGLPIEIEVRTRSELREALANGATSLLLDNLTPDEAREWIAEIAGRATVEISGGMTLANVRAYALTGADFVSSGAITHSAPAVDLSFRLELL
jgi:nicotinate-nucleotide pyrophosphorylase (carboxylating)